MRNLFCSLLLVTLAYSQTRPASAVPLDLGGYYLARGGRAGGFGRGGSSGLIPFPRSGRAQGSWGVDSKGSNKDGGAVFYLPRGSRGGTSGLIPFPRVGRAQGTWEIPDSDVAEVNEPIKKSSSSSYSRRLIRSPSSAYSRRILRSDPALAAGGHAANSFTQRWLRSSGAFNRRLLRSDQAFNRRLLRSSDSFHRRLLRSDPSEAYKRRILKRSSDSPMGKSKKQSLIPFPRTGKRSADTAEEMALVYQHMDNLDNLGTSDYDVDDEQYNSPDDAVVDDVVGDDGESSDGGDDDDEKVSDITGSL